MTTDTSPAAAGNLTFSRILNFSPAAAFFPQNTTPAQTRAFLRALRAEGILLRPSSQAQSALALLDAQNPVAPRQPPPEHLRQRTLCLLGAETMSAARIASLLRAWQQIVLLDESMRPRAVHARQAGILLAGGASSRFGKPKQLLSYHGIPFVRAAAQTALASSLSPVIVVLGANADVVRPALRGLPVRIVYTPHWQAGQSASLQAGLRALDEAVRAAIILLADQPQVTPEAIQNLCEIHRQTLAPIIAPFVGARRANPVLLDAAIFQDLFSLQGDTGARALFQRYPPLKMPWHDENLLKDIDTPEDYRRLFHP